MATTPSPGQAAVTGPERDAILEALAAVERRIDAACARAGRDRSGVTLLPVTKTVPPQRIAVALEAGYRALGENRVQEAVPKREALEAWGADWHMVGHLQRNKAAQALAFADCIQSVDRAALVDRLADRLGRCGEGREVLLQVNTSGAASQYGVDPAEAAALASRIAARPELNLTGLMTIGRLAHDPEDTRACFRLLHDLRERLRDALGVPLPVLSMGMSGDLEVAVEEGATLVRVGSAVFGAREPSG